MVSNPFPHQRHQLLDSAADVKELNQHHAGLRFCHRRVFFAQGIVKGIEMWISHQMYSHQTETPLQFVEFFSTPTP